MRLHLQDNPYVDSWQLPKGNWQPLNRVGSTLGCRVVKWEGSKRRSGALNGLFPVNLFGTVLCFAFQRKKPQAQAMAGQAQAAQGSPMGGTR